MINGKQRISLGAASLSAVALVATLFMPWMGFIYGGDIDQSSANAVSSGGLPHPIADQSAFQLSAAASSVIVLAALAVVVVSAAVIFLMPWPSKETAGWTLVGAGVVGLIAVAILVFGVESNPIGIPSGWTAYAPLMFKWGALIGAKLAVLTSGIIVLAGGFFVLSSRTPDASPKRVQASAA
jgi:hypothetical protein